MARLLIASFTEPTDALIKIMVALIGKDKKIHIKKEIFREICASIRKNRYETGGIIGAGLQGEICAFQPDDITTAYPYEYRPNTQFLNDVIERWAKVDIAFAGIIHSHMHNSCISREDIAYAREILMANDFMKNVLMGIIDLSGEDEHIEWYLIDSETAQPR